jgi:tripartite motif-containing protein 71
MGWRSAIGVGLVFAAGIPASDETDFFLGDFKFELRDLANPSSVVVTADDRIAVLERGAGRVRVFDASGAEVVRWGTSGSNAGELLFPADFAVDGGEVFIADTDNHRVQVFATDGTFVRAWGRRGEGDGEFIQPSAIAVRDDRVIVAEWGNDRVQSFTRAGEFVASFDGPGGESPRLRDPSDVVIDDAGAVYVADSGNSRIVRWSVGGAAESWGEYGPFVGFFDEPSGVALAGGQLVVVDRRNHRLQWFSRAGEFHGAWGVHEVILREGKGKIHYPTTVAIAPSGAFAVVCESSEDRLQVFSPASPETSRDLPLPQTNKTEETHFGDAIGIDGDLLVLSDPENNYNLVFDISGEVPINIARFGERGDSLGLFMYAGGFAVNVSAKRIVMADPVGGQVQTYLMDYEPGGELKYLPHMTSFASAVHASRLARDLSARSATGRLTLADIEPTPEGGYMLLDRLGGLAIEVDSAFKVVRSWPLHESADSTVWDIVDLDVSTNGAHVVAVDRAAARVRVFDRTGARVRAWGTRSEEDGEFVEPVAVACGDDGSVYVVDRLRHRVLKFDMNGSLRLEWGDRGNDMGAFWKPSRIATARDGRVFVVDQGNHRAQIFSRDGEWMVTFGIGRAYTPQRLPRRNER